MIVELGNFCLSLAFIASLMQTICGFFGFSHKVLENCAVRLAISQFILLAFCLIFLSICFARSDFSVALVAAHSHTAQPFLYKLAAVWGNHEGSMLLWSAILALYGAILVRQKGDLRPLVIAVQGGIGALFLGFILYSSNPFDLIYPTALEGESLNPVLQDIALIAHPPLLYLGYVGLSTCFSFAVAGMWNRKIDKQWSHALHPWLLASWSFLTIGIFLGSYWAYYELGWGGWWFWDPVENASLMPWLLATALIHTNRVMMVRGILASWTLILAILAFCLSLMGTFIVRSGILTSVHSFASDPQRGVFLLVIMGFLIGGSLTLFAFRDYKIPQKASLSLISRESALFIHSLIFAIASGTVAFGTLYPLMVEAITGSKISIGEPYFDRVFTALMIPALLLLPMGTALAWKKGLVRHFFRNTLILTGICVVFWVVFSGYEIATLVVGFALSCWIFWGSLWDFRRHKDLGRCLAHLGVAVLLIGISFSVALTKEDIRAVKIGDSWKISDYQLTLKSLKDHRGANFKAQIGIIDITTDKGDVIKLRPEKRIYLDGRPTTEAAIHSTLLRDIYAVLGDAQPNGLMAVRIWVKPMILWIWIGALMMALGGLYSMIKRRL